MATWVRGLGKKILEWDETEYAITQVCFTELSL